MWIWWVYRQKWVVECRIATEVLADKSWWWCVLRSLTKVVRLESHRAAAVLGHDCSLLVLWELLVLLQAVVEVGRHSLLVLWLQGLYVWVVEPLLGLVRLSVE